MASLEDWKTGVDLVTDAAGTLFAMLAGGWALYQYWKSTRLRAADTLLKMEEEFRNILPTYERLDNHPTYVKDIKPILDAEAKGELIEDDKVAELTRIDRCLRFLFLCSVLNRTLGADRFLGSSGGVLSQSYYYYIGIVLESQARPRPELVAYVKKYYPLLTDWVRRNEKDLRDARMTTAVLVTPASTTARKVVGAGG